MAKFKSTSNACLYFRDLVIGCLVVASLALLMQVSDGMEPGAIVKPNVGALVGTWHMVPDGDVVPMMYATFPRIVIRQNGTFAMSRIPSDISALPSLTESWKLTPNENGRWSMEFTGRNQYFSANLMRLSPPYNLNFEEGGPDGDYTDSFQRAGDVITAPMQIGSLAHATWSILLFSASALLCTAVVCNGLSLLSYIPGFTEESALTTRLGCLKCGCGCCAGPIILPLIYFGLLYFYCRDPDMDPGGPLFWPIIGAPFGLFCVMVGAAFRRFKANRRKSIDPECKAHHLSGNSPY